jgi:predicted nucleic acid-binding protein
MADRIHKLTDPLPPVLYWDASFIVNFAYSAARYFQECADFLTRLDVAQTISYASTLALDEACFVLLQLKVQEDHPSERFWDIYNTDPSIIEPYMNELQELVEGIYTHPRIRLVGTEPPFALESLAHMRAFHFLPRDAYHLASMRHYGIDSIVTLDSDFLIVPDIHIYTCAPSILTGNRKSL